MLTKGAIGNLVNRYRAVLKKCNLINTFGSLAMASMLVLGGAGMAGAADVSYADFVATADGKVITVTEDTVVKAADSAQSLHSFTLDVADGVNLTLNEIGRTGYSGGVKNVTGNGNISIINNASSIVALDSGGTINVKNLYVNTNDGNPATRADSAKKGGSTTIKATEDVYFVTGDHGVHTEGGTVTIEARNITMETGQRAIINSYDGNVILKATGDVNLYASVCNFPGAKDSGKIEITANNITIDSGHDGVINAAEGIVKLNATNDLTIKAGKDGWAIWLAEDSHATEGNGDIIVQAGGNTVVEGDVVNEGISDIIADFNGEGSSLTGKIETSGTGATDIGFDNATWNVTGESSVSNLTVNNSLINVASYSVDVAELSGDGATVKTVVENGDAAGSLKVGTVADGSAPEFSVIPTNAKGEALTADDISADQLKSVIKSAITSDNEAAAEKLTEKATASAAQGIVNEAVTVDEKGNIVSGGGVSSVTEAVLESASVNTVALDKILTNDVRKRLGDIRSDKNQTGVWMRWDGGKLKGNSGLTNNFNTIQIGGDTKINDSWRIGAAGSFTHGDGDFDRGNSELEGFSFALYTTWMAENGMFADVVARIGHFSTEMNVEGLKGDMDSRVASLSGEYGWRFSVCDQFFIEPQVELAYTYVSSDDIRLGDARFSFDSVDSLTGRAGLVAGWNLPDDMGNVYARASVLQQFMGDAKVTGFSGIGPTVHKTDGEDTWLEYGVGANIKLNDKTYIWADIERTEGAKVEEEWRGTVGIRYSF